MSPCVIRRVLVTGSSGRVGRSIHSRLKRLGVDVVGLDINPSSTADFVVDLGDGPALARALDGADAVVHVAALHAPHVGRRSEAEFHRINVEGTAHLLETARRAGVRRFVLTSTTALFGAAATPPGRSGWVDEALDPQPLTIYHRSKLEAEALAREAASADFGVRVLRMSRCFPEPANVMALFRLHRGIDPRDVADAHVLALQSAERGFDLHVVSGPTPFQPNDTEALWCDAPAVLRARASALVEAFEARGWPLPARIDRVYSSRRAMVDLGWQPQFGFQDVLKQNDESSIEVLPPDLRGTWSSD